MVPTVEATGLYNKGSGRPRPEKRLSSQLRGAMSASRADLDDPAAGDGSAYTYTIIVE